MRKRMIPPTQPTIPTPALEEAWLDLSHLAQVEFTLEEADHPVEAALLPGRAEGWRAAVPGPQLLRLLFEPPQRLRRIRLRFTETDMERTQEFVLRYSLDYGQTFRDIVRQQWSFSPRGSTSEVEDYHVELTGVTALELAITPDIAGREARTELSELRLA